MSEEMLTLNEIPNLVDQDSIPPSSDSLDLQLPPTFQIDENQDPNTASTTTKFQDQFDATVELNSCTEPSLYGRSENYNWVDQMGTVEK